MFAIKDILNFIKVNKGEIISYGNDYFIQVYDSEALQANISQDDKIIVKIEQRGEKVAFFCPQNSDESIIDYSKGCYVEKNGNIFEMCEQFAEHKDFENIMIAMLQLKNNE